MFANSAISMEAEKYFQSLNPMAGRVIEDISSIRKTHEEKWDDLNIEDKDRIISETFIGNEARQKYACYPSNNPDYESFPRLSVRSGEKYIVDDDTQSKTGSGHSWRDEHSAPFSWETQSQLDLSFTDDKKQTRSIQQQMRSRPKQQEQNHTCFLETFCPCTADAEKKTPKRQTPKPPPRKPPPPVPPSREEEKVLLEEKIIPSPHPPSPPKPDEKVTKEICVNDVLKKHPGASLKIENDIDSIEVSLIFTIQ
ncbi:hypothetical protein CHUAL_012724 [Chamberlinius hualienensis]